MMRHPTTGHEIEEEQHEDCKEVAEELVHELEENDMPKEILEHAKELVDHLEEYEKVEKDGDGHEMKDEEDLSDKELEDEYKKQRDGRPHMMLKIKIKPAEK